MAQYCPLCGKVTKCTDDCEQCLKEEKANEETEEKSKNAEREGIEL